MKTAIKTMMIGVAACAFAAPAFAYTINGTIPPGHRPVVIPLHRPIKPGFMKLSLTAPPKNAGVPYALSFLYRPGCESVRLAH